MKRFEHKIFEVFASRQHLDKCIEGMENEGFELISVTPSPCSINLFLAFKRPVGAT